MQPDLARRLADLMLVEAIVLSDGAVSYANLPLRERATREAGTDELSDMDHWELLAGPWASDARDWYEVFSEGDAPSDRIDLGGGGEGLELLAIRLGGSHVLARYGPDDQAAAIRCKLLHTWEGVYLSYLDEAGIGHLVLKGDDGSLSLEGMSPFAAELLEVDPETSLGRPVSSVITMQGIEDLERKCLEVLEGSSGSSQIEARFLSGEGQPIILDMMCIRGIWEEEPAVFCLFSDVTEEQNVLSEFRRFAQAFDVMPDTIVIADGEFNTLYVNPTGLERSGYTLEEVIGEPASLFAGVSIGSEATQEVLSALFETGIWHGERTAKAKDGTAYPVEIAVSMTLDTDGNPEMVTVISRDVTARKMAEQSTQRARERAEFFTDLMSHDINNYIQGVLGRIELLSAGELTGDQRKQVENAWEQASRISELISRVRAISRAQHAGELEPVDLRAIVEEVLSDLRQRYKDAAPDITLEAPEGGLAVNADQLLRDLVMNIVDNAVKYSGDEAARVEVRLRAVSSRFRNLVRLEVSDHGPGIPDDDKKQVFYRFVRRMDAGEGSGLGLSLVMALADRYMGRAWIEDRVPGDHTRGCRVVVELPAASE